MGMHVIMTGNPADGFAVIGPFNNAEEASEYADEHFREEEWWLLPLHAPED